MDLPGRSSAGSSRTSERNAGFLMEALLLLAFLVVALAIFVSLFSQASRMGERSSELNRAVLLASSVAEQFASDPTGIAGESQSDSLTARCDVVSERTEQGTLYHATIRVTNEAGDEVYSLATASYRGGGAS